MGILDAILGTAKKSYREKEISLPPALKEKHGQVGLSVHFLPVRLAAKKDNRVDMIVRVSNDSPNKQLLSFEAFVPPREMIGFDSTVVNKHYEKKLGHLEAGASTEFAVPIYGTTQTRPGNYPVGLAVNVHFVDYSKVMPTGVKRKIALRVV